MAIRIGEDGTIINGDEVISSSGTIIRDDGTIESSNIAVSNIPQRNYVSHAAPVSPLENGANRQASPPVEATQAPTGQPSRRMTAASTKSIADLEYDLMVAEGHVRGSVPKTPLIVAIVMLLCGTVLSVAHCPGLDAAQGVAVGQRRKSSNDKKHSGAGQNQKSHLRLLELFKQSYPKLWHGIHLVLPPES